MALGALDHRLFFDDATPPWWDPTAHTPAWEDGAPDVVVVVDGELDAATSPRLDQALSEICPDVSERIVVDCSDMSFCDSHGLKVLLCHRDRLAAAGVQFQIVTSRALEFVMDHAGERLETVSPSTGSREARSKLGRATSRRFVRLGTPLA